MKTIPATAFLVQPWPKTVKIPFRLLPILLLAALIGASQWLLSPPYLPPIGLACSLPVLPDVTVAATDWGVGGRSIEGVLLMSLIHGSYWAELSVMFLLALLVGTSYRHQQTRQKQMIAIRNQIAADLHDEIGSSLSSIGLLGALARNGLANPIAAASLLNQLVEETRQVSNALDDVVWSVSPRDEQSAYLGARMYRYAATLFENAGIAYQIDIPGEGLMTRVPTEQQRDLYFFFKEVINNLLKHAGATSVTITLLPQKDGLHLTITDNGRGFDPSAQTVRNGLRNLRLRATALRGRLSIQSALGQGTTIGLWFPLPSH